MYELECSCGNIVYRKRKLKKPVCRECELKRMRGRVHKNYKGGTHPLTVKCVGYHMCHKRAKWDFPACKEHELDFRLSLIQNKGY